MTEARVRHVMQKTAANFNAFVVAGLVTKERALGWTEDLSYLQLQEALAWFEIQLTTPGRARFGLRYTVSSDGSLHQDSSSGGIDLYGLPKGTTAALCAQLASNAPAHIRPHLAARGWNFNGTQLEGETADQRAFSRDGYGLVRHAVGVWP